MNLKYTFLLSFTAALLFISCGSNKKLIEWRGLGVGDSYLEIRDSILIYNGVDGFISTYDIDSISNDSIFCNSLIAEGIDTKVYQNFAYSKGFVTIEYKDKNRSQAITNILKSKTLKTHRINKVVYSVYGDYEALLSQYELKSIGVIMKNGTKSSISNQLEDKQKVQHVFDKLSILDLDNFVWSDINYLMASHASCHCLEIDYNVNSKLLYCRQFHNNYIQDILSTIKSK